MNALGMMIDSWGKKDVAQVACEKIAVAEAAALKLEQAQTALAAAQDAAEKAKAEAEEAVHRIPPVEPVVENDEVIPTPAAVQAIESEDERIARIVSDLLSRKAAETNNVSTATVTVTELQVEKPAEELTLSPAPVAGPTAAKGGNYPAARQNKQRR